MLFGYRGKTWKLCGNPIDQRIVRDKYLHWENVGDKIRFRNAANGVCGVPESHIFLIFSSCLSRLSFPRSVRPTQPHAGQTVSVSGTKVPKSTQAPTVVEFQGETILVCTHVPIYLRIGTWAPTPSTLQWDGEVSVLNSCPRPSISRTRLPVRHSHDVKGQTGSQFEEMRCSMS